MTSQQTFKCNMIIHGASAASAAVGFGLAQIPAGDMVPITAIQIGMIISLGKVFGVDITESYAETAAFTFLTENVGRMAARSLVGLIPGFGNLVKASVASTFTESLGWAIAHRYAEEDI